jgi:hypothetical protein
MNRSQNAYAFGVRYGVFNSLIPVLAAINEKLGSVLSIAVSNRIPWTAVPWGSFSQLLRCPCIGRQNCHRCVYNPSCFKFKDHEEKDRSERQVMNHREVASPDTPDMVFDEGCPSLTKGLLALGHIPLDGTFADLDVKLQQLATDPLCAL